MKTLENILIAIALSVGVYILIGFLIVTAYGMGNGGTDMLSEHYRNFLNLIL